MINFMHNLALFWIKTHFSPFGRLFTLGISHILQKCPKFWANFSTVKIMYVVILTVNGLGYFLCVFFTNSSGHPGHESTRFASLHLSVLPHISRAGLPDGFFKPKNPSLGKIGRALDWRLLIYFMTIWNILRAFGTFMTIWFI
jgi:hypothetical protein